MKNIRILSALIVLSVGTNYAADSSALLERSKKECLVERYVTISAQHIQKGNEDGSNGEGKGSAKYEFFYASRRTEALNMSKERLRVAIKQILKTKKKRADCDTAFKFAL